MARGESLDTLISMTRSEAFQTNDPALGQNNRHVVIQKINRINETLYRDYDWPFMRAFGDVSTSGGERFYDFPSEVNEERIEKVEYKWGSKWAPLRHRIYTTDFNSFDSEEDVRSDPPAAWDWYGDDQFQLFPMSDSDGTTIRFTGIRPLTVLVNGSDLCDLDSHLVAIMSAAELTQDKDLGKKLQASASTLLSRVKPRLNNRTGFGFATGNPRPLAGRVPMGPIPPRF